MAVAVSPGTGRMRQAGESTAELMARFRTGHSVDVLSRIQPIGLAEAPGSAAPANAVDNVGTSKLRSAEPERVTGF
jgi:hypothetical protein